jgi:hypothetical protein
MTWVIFYHAAVHVLWAAAWTGATVGAMLVCVVAIKESR